MNAWLICWYTCGHVNIYVDGCSFPQVVGEVVPVNVIKAYETEEVKLHSFSILKLD
jgi:hypothetical protein